MWHSPRPLPGRCPSLVASPLVAGLHRFGLQLPRLILQTFESPLPSLEYGPVRPPPVHNAADLRECSRAHTATCGGTRSATPDRRYDIPRRKSLLLPLSSTLFFPSSSNRRSRCGFHACPSLWSASNPNTASLGSVSIDSGFPAIYSSISWRSGCRLDMPCRLRRFPQMLP